MNKLSILVFVCSSFYISQVCSQDFKAAVVEYHPTSFETPVIPETRLMQNVAAYEKLAGENSAGYDIIVFPESTLYNGAGHFDTAPEIFPYTTIIPEPVSNVIPCDDIEYKYASHFKQLSCLAKKIQKFIVINLPENVPCKGDEDCPTFGYKIYNTNVVFNGEGKVVAKYQKFNLFGEPEMTKPQKQVVTFKLKNDVTIGTFTCFDIMFPEPALDMVKNVQAIVYPLKWYSELPFLTALQTQQQWAQELDVILLAAGGNVPVQASGGSGIFKGKDGFVDGTFTSENVSSVFYADFNTARTNRTYSIANIDVKAKQLDTFPLWKDNLQSYSSKTLDFNERNVETQVCNSKEANKICCDFTVTTTINEQILQDGKNHYQYHLVAFSGVRSFSGVATGGLEICAIIACKDKDINSCGVRFDDYNTISWPLKFTKLEVSANFQKDAKRKQFPNSLLSNIQPLPVTESKWSTQDKEDVVQRKHVLAKEQERLLTFGIFGRDYNRDGHEVTKPQPPPPPPKDNDGGANFINLHLGSIGVACSLVLINSLRV